MAPEATALWHQLPAEFQLSGQPAVEHGTAPSLACPPAQWARPEQQLQLLHSCNDLRDGQESGVQRMRTMKMVCTFMQDSFTTALQQLIKPLHCCFEHVHVLTAASGGGLEGKDQSSQGQACGSAQGSRCKAGASQIRQQARPGGAVCRPASGVEGAVGQEERRDLLWQPHNQGGEGWLLLLGACGGQSTYHLRVQAASRQMMTGFHTPLCNGFCIAGIEALGGKCLEACA